MNENNPNNQIPVINGNQNNVPTVGTNMTVSSPQQATSNVVLQNTVSSTVPNQGNTVVSLQTDNNPVTLQPTSNVVSRNTAGVQSNTLSNQGVNVGAPQAIPEVSAVPAAVAAEKSSHDEEANKVTEIIASSIDSRNGKVNLLTPAQKAELLRKKEEARKEKENYQAPPVGKFKRFFSIFILILLFAIVLFLPEINEVIISLREGQQEPEDVVITTGTLRCTSDSTSEKYNHSYTYEFDFTDSKLDKLTYVETTVGDELVDEADLNSKLDKCNELKLVTGGLVGVNVSCSLYEGTFIKEQIIDFNTINHDLVTAAYSEAGGIYPEFEAGDSIDMIERNMKAANNTCERLK